MAFNAAADEAVSISIALDFEESKVRRFLHNIEKFAESNRISLSDTPYLVALSIDDSSSESILESEQILNSAAEGKSTFLVDENLKIIQIKNDAPNVDTCAQLSENWKLPVIMVTKEMCLLGLQGKIIGAGIGKDRPALLVEKFSKPFAQFDHILEDHYRSWLHNERNLKYWKDRDNRILVAGKTEEIFQGSLFVWLDDFVADKVFAFCEPSGFGQDKTDIHVTTVDNRNHVIEIKWLGKNASQTEYKEPRIAEGLEQVRIYLSSGKFSDGRAVFYDARPKEISDKERDYSGIVMHQDCKKPCFVFLESEMPSVKARKVGKKKSSTK